MKKVFGIFAMMLAIAACNKNEIELPVENAGTIPFIATIRVGDKNTKAITDNADGLLTSWAVGEKVALIYTVGTTTYVKEAEVTPQTDGTATISTTLDGSPADDTDVTIVYPASAVDETTKDVKTNLLASQKGLLTGDGSISKMYDLRKTTSPAKLKIDGTTASLKGSVSLTNQVAIFKFTVKNAAGTATINVKPLTITIGSQGYVITPNTATSELYAALPAVSDQTVTFTATGSDNKTYTCSKASVSFDDGKYYQSTLKMAPAAATGHALSASVVGEVVGTDGLAYAVADKDNLPTGVTAAGMVAYKSSSNGLVIALADEASTMTWDTANGATTGAAAHTPAVTGQAWKLPSQAEWKQMFSANGGNEESCTGLNTAITTAGGTALHEQEPDLYWSSTEDDEYDAYRVILNNGNVYINTDSKDTPYRVRACLEFDIPLITSPAVGQVIGANGVNYADADAATAAGTTAVAKIVYVGSDTAEAAYNHGLALALSDANDSRWSTSNGSAHTNKFAHYDDFTSESGLQYNATHNTDEYPAFKAAIANNSTAAPTGCSAWFLASGYQWKKMITAAGGASALQTLAGLQENYTYWSSSENNTYNAWHYNFGSGGWGCSGKSENYSVRSCLAF